MVAVAVWLFAMGAILAWVVSKMAFVNGFDAIRRARGSVTHCSGGHRYGREDLERRHCRTCRRLVWTSRQDESWKAYQAEHGAPKSYAEVDLMRAAWKRTKPPTAFEDWRDDFEPDPGFP